MKDSSTASRDVLLRRLHSEYQEMPGLRLTCEQVQRLCGIDQRTCRDLLDELVKARFLSRSGDGRYVRSTEGRLDVPPRMAHASLKSAPSRARRVS